MPGGAAQVARHTHSGRYAGCDSLPGSYSYAGLSSNARGQCRASSGAASSGAASLPDRSTDAAPAHTPQPDAAVPDESAEPGVAAGQNESASTPGLTASAGNSIVAPAGPNVPASQPGTAVPSGEITAQAAIDVTPTESKPPAKQRGRPKKIKMPPPPLADIDSGDSNATQLAEPPAAEGVTKPKRRRRKSSGAETVTEDGQPIPVVSGPGLKGAAAVAVEAETHSMEAAPTLDFTACVPKDPSPWEGVTKWVRSTP